jgi:hypothetical protein
MKIARALLLTLLALALALPTAARAATPSHTNFSGTAPGVDLCGITTTLTFSGVDNFWPILDSSGNQIAFKDTHQEKDVATAANGKSIEDHIAVQQIATSTTNPDGTFTEVDTFKGVPQQLSTPHGPVLTQGDGLITFVDQLDKDGNVISQTIVVDNGPHPDADGSLFCQIVTAALS